MEIALPRELKPSQRADLVRAFVHQEIGELHAYQWAIHTPLAADGGEQPHVHLMFSERQMDGIDRDPGEFKRYNAKSPEKGGARKAMVPSAGQTLSAVERSAELRNCAGVGKPCATTIWCRPGTAISASTCEAMLSAASTWSQSANSCPAPGGSGEKQSDRAAICKARSLQAQRDLAIVDSRHPGEILRQEGVRTKAVAEGGEASRRPNVNASSA